MKIILQHRTSRLFLSGRNDWTSDVKDARNFQQIVSAIDFVSAGRLTNLDVLMHFGDPRYDVRLPASPEDDSWNSQSL
ncbi:MAG: hypothetical protein JWR26_2321 [Pedosphaera sp.]|jgi:hypothetical protein|nr:hypothetical protein [Pedosphaera sp.]